MANLHTTVPDQPTVLMHAVELAAAWHIPFRITNPLLGPCAECARRDNTTPAAVAVEWADRTGARVLTPFCLALNCIATAMTRAQLSGNIAALLIPNGFSASRRPGGCLDEAATA